MNDNKKSGPIILTDENFEETIKQAGIPVFVDFYADWCGPCQMAAPIIDKLANDDAYQGKIVIAKCNIDNNNQIAAKYGVRSIPTMLVLEAEDDEIKLRKTEVGFPGEKVIKQILDKYKKN